MLALMRGHCATARYLIEQGAVVTVEYQGNTPLTEAVRAGDVSLCECLLRAGANPHARYGGVSALDVARSLGQQELIDVLARYQTEQERE